jgi:hypothetical protein
MFDHHAFDAYKLPNLTSKVGYPVRTFSAAILMSCDVIRSLVAKNMNKVFYNYGSTTRIAPSVTPSYFCFTFYSLLKEYFNKTFTKHVFVVLSF